MHWRKLLNKQYLAAEDFAGKEVLVTLTGFDRKDLPDMNAKKSESADENDIPKKSCAIIRLKETPKGWVSCEANARCLQMMFGDDTDGWVGKRILIHTVTEHGKLCIRIKGSPDITETVRCTVRRPRCKPITYTLVPTTGKGSAPMPVAEPDVEPETKPAA